MIKPVVLWGPVRQYALLMFLGIFASLAFAPINATLSAFIAFPMWLYLLEASQTHGWKKHFALGWWFGLGYFTGGLYWITFSLGVDLNLFWWLIPFSLFGIPSILAVYLGIFAIVLKYINCTGISRCFWFAGLWTLAEIAWGSGPLGLPWNPLGTLWSAYSSILQSASVIGTNGLTLVTCLFVSSPILMRKHLFKIPHMLYLGCLTILLLGTISWGMGRPQNTLLMQNTHMPLIRIVQPSVPQDLDWAPEKAAQQFYGLMELSQTPSKIKPDLILWPESALPLLLDENTSAREAIARMLGPQAYLISGSLRRDIIPGKKSKIYNSIVMVDSRGDVAASYDKHHLVPFGEYIPFRQIIPAAITKITSGETDFSAGTGLKTVDLSPWPSFSPLVCFEVIFEGAVVSPHQPRPLWLLVLTNDAWYGHTSGPYQHLELTRMRSIEEGLPLVRAANSGISTAFDAFGQEIDRKGLGQRGVLDVHLPASLQEPPPFAKHGQFILLVMLALCLILGMMFRKLR